MNFTEIIKNDMVLSAYDYGIIYQIIMRLKELGLICQCKDKECKNV